MGTKDVHVCLCGHLRREHAGSCVILGCRCVKFSRKGVDITSESRPVLRVRKINRGDRLSEQ